MPARAVRLIVVAVALLILGSSAASAAPRAATVDVTIVNFAFVPSVVTIDKGDTIRWTNLDSTAHSAVTPLSGFVTTVLVQNQSTTTTFERPGTYEYVCGVHPQTMRGTLIVRGAPVAETPGPAGPEGHVVLDSFAKARPDRLAGAPAGGELYLWIAAALALLAVGRLAWMLRRS